MFLLLLPAWLTIIYTDWRRREIHNGIVIYVALTGLVSLYESPLPVFPALWWAAVILLAGYGVWRLGVVGAGDVKLMVALSLWHAGELKALLIFVALFGGVISIVCLLLQVLAVDTVKRGVPYGLAIVAASAFLKTREFWL